MKIPLRSKWVAFAGAVFCAAGVLTAHAANPLVTFSVDMSNQLANSSFTPGTDVVRVRGTFNNWDAGTTPDGVALVQEGSSSIYTNSATDTYDPTNGTSLRYVFLIRHPGNDAYEPVADFNNRASKIPTDGGGLVLPTPFFGDTGAAVTNLVTFQVDMAQQIALGQFDVAANTVEVQGNFNGWGPGTLTNDSSILRTNQFGLVTSNVYVATISSAASPNATMDYKFVIQPFNPAHYESASPINQDSGGNRFFTEIPNLPLVLPVANFSDQPFAPVAKVTFNVDMSAVLLSDPNFEPTTVEIDGDFNSWGTGVPCTNNPDAANTNLFSATISIGEGAAVNYQFRYQNSSGTQYDHAPDGNNRFLQVPTAATVNVPAVFFANILPGDLLNVDTTVVFSVNMTNAVGFPTGPIFDPGSDHVYLNGDFLGWLHWDPISLSSEQLTNDPPGSEDYSFTMTFPKGHARELTYKYGIDGADNEAGQNLNHFRYIRSTNGTDNLPLDIFGNQLVEPKFGNLAIGSPAGGMVPITWLGFPGVHLQSNTNLVGGTWTDMLSTDAQNSTAVSVSGSHFFRLIQPQQ